MRLNDKDVRIRNKKAIRLIKERAIKENRSAANAAAQTIIESLGKPDNLSTNSTKNGENEQA